MESPIIEMEKDELLIEEVRLHNILYEKSCKSYKNVKVKAEVWRKIAEKLGMNELECTTRWKSLRDKFLREYKKKNETPSGSGADNRPEWEYYENLTFLIRHIQPRKTKTNVEREKITEDDFEIDEDIEVVNESVEDSSILSATPRKRLKKADSDDVGKQLVDTMGALQNFLNNNNNVSAPENDINTRIRVMLSGLNPDNKKLAETKIIEYLCKCQLEEIKSGNINNVSFF